MNEVITEDRGTTRVITLNRPDKRNALNDALISELKTALLAADENSGLSAVIVRGAGKDFCSGADLSALQKIAGASYEENLEDARNLAELFAMPRRMKLPVIAAVQGRALAGGCGLAMACDIILATASAQFGFPEVKIGFVPAIVTTFLRRNISEKRAFELITQGFEFTAPRAFELGLVNKIFEAETFEARTLEYASIYSRTSRSAVELSKALLYQMDSLKFDHAIDLGSEFNVRARMSDDCQKGIAKFLEKT